ncbi:hypothetical protein Pyn_09211 [Prunus yedoensis var. nudiflora]|uniref:Uncharacterized protein n=1 Tax=Prunus yedoensis var. nudiflora TaxID=2094558 RepID=A0A314YV05_PRUYE|nr:hypothetical protein Pyn_09211 [Prunus yedoensis var. nudiflora]
MGRIACCTRRQSHMVGWRPGRFTHGFGRDGARFVRRGGSAVRGGLVIDVAGLYPFDLPRTTQRPRPRKDSLLWCVVQGPRVVLLLDRLAQCMPSVNIPSPKCCTFIMQEVITMMHKSH